MKHIVLVLGLCMVLAPRSVSAQSSSTIAWDDDPDSYVTGYAVTIDGIRVDYYMTPAGAGGVCGCSIALPFSGGRHTIVVSAYNPIGEVQSPALVVAPRADAGGPYSGRAAVPVVVNAGGSTAPTGTLTSYEWTWGDGTASVGTSPVASHVYATGGTFSITLTVTDNGGATASATTSAAISANQPPTVTLVSPVAGAAFTAPAAIALVPSVADSDGSIAKVDYFAGTTLVATAWSAPFAATWNNVPAGNYALVAVATDNSGATGQSSPVEITVAQPPTVPGYALRRTITIDHAQVPESATDFPFLFSGTYPSLATVAYGGQVRSPNGYDIILTSDAAGTTKLDHEIESYDPATGRVALWVRLPVLSASADTVLYLWYGNASISTSQENRAGLWNSSYRAVYHLGDSAANTNVIDSSNSALSGTSVANTNTRSVAGQVGGALSQDGVTDSIDAGNAIPMGASDFTISAWVRAASTQGTGANSTIATILGNGAYTTSAAGYVLFLDASSGRIRAALSDGSSRALGAGVGPDLRDDAWHFVTVVYNRASSMLTYVDAGAQETTDISALAGVDIAADSNAFIGRSRYNLLVAGALDEVRISSVARSAGWLLTEFRNQSSPSTFYVVGSATTSGN